MPEEQEEKPMISSNAQPEQPNQMNEGGAPTVAQSNTDAGLEEGPNKPESVEVGDEAHADGVQEKSKDNVNGNVDADADVSGDQKNDRAQSDAPESSMPTADGTNEQSEDQQEQKPKEQQEQPTDATKKEDKPKKIDDFKWVLKPDASVPTDKRHELWWYAAAAPIPKKTELALLGALMKFGKKERGMMCGQPFHRVKRVREQCKNLKMPLMSALSLRRHHIHRLNPTMSKAALKLGTEEQVRQTAQCFEEDIEEYLRSKSVPFWTEEDQRKHIAARHEEDPDAAFPPTPDFILKEPVHLKRFQKSKGKKRVPIVIEEATINWIEVKNFYGASSIGAENRSAVGNLRATATKYMKLFGPGAFVFSYRFGDELARDLKDIGALCLDCTSPDIRCERQREHLKTYCTDKEGSILI